MTCTFPRALQERCGTAPAETTTRQIHRALRQTGLRHRIDVVDAEPVPPAEGTVGSGSPAWWRDHGSEYVEPCEANPLLVDQVGVGGMYGQWCVVGAGGVETDLPAVDRR